ncbi:nuclear transport factor 2 family protein [Streptomyces sp. NPDC093586]|uniref:nuclear transport factor 2 family protein n=1 Tax=Streptomyces sp. NPDC093586 TaxID=3366042 RepID=UPI0037F816DC
MTKDIEAPPGEIVDAGDLVMALGHYSGTSLATGDPTRTRFVHVWRSRNGVPGHFETVLDTRTMVAAT